MRVKKQRILCFGDSNTWGFVPVTRQRYEATVRWTGVLADRLGENYEVIEEGVNGRTTTFDDPCEEGKNGKKALPGCLREHAPLDLVILMLGTNDLKSCYRSSAKQAADGIRALIRLIREFDRGLPVLVASPVTIAANVSELGPGMNFGDHDPNAHLESLRFSQEYRAAAGAENALFFDAALYAAPSALDGLHLDPESHLRLGEAFAQRIKGILHNKPQE